MARSTEGTQPMTGVQPPSAVLFNLDRTPELACPACHGELCQEPGRVVCMACGRAYPVVDGIPVLIPARAGQR